MSFTVEGLLSGEGGFSSEKYQHSYTRVYQLKATNRVTDDEKQALLAIQNLLGFTPYAPHPTDPYARVMNISARTKAAFNNGMVAGLLWEGTIEFGPVNPLTRGESNPPDQPIRYRLDPITVEVPAFVDKDKNPITNSAGDYYDPGLTQETTEYLLTVMRNETTIDVPTLMALSGKGEVNESTWNGFPEKTVKILPIKIPEKLWSETQQELYYPMEYVFHIKFETWTRKVVDQGFGELVSTSGNPKRRTIIDGSGQPTTVAVLLDGSGHQLQRPFDHTNIVINEHEINNPIDFSQFNLDDIPY